jgi:uncharacterized protein
MKHETFRWICMSFDDWVVSFGLSRSLIDRQLVVSPTACVVLATVALIDLYLQSWFFTTPRATALAVIREG